jgi:hypothetical protein
LVDKGRKKTFAAEEGAGDRGQEAGKWEQWRKVPFRGFRGRKAESIVSWDFKIAAESLQSSVGNFK